MMIAAWFVLPRRWLFHFTNMAAFPLALLSWMYSDVYATNVLAADSQRALRLLDDSARLGNLLDHA